MTSTRERFEHAQLVRMAADWRCQRCGAEHGRPHPNAPSTRVFLRVVGDEARCQFCAPSTEEQ